MRECRIPAVVDVPASASLSDVVFRRAEAEPGVIMLRRRVGAGSWQDVTAARFRAEVAALAKGLIAVGIEPGDRIGLMSRTRYEWSVVDYAIWAAGAVTVPVYETSSAGQVEWILGDSAARAVFAETNGHEKIISSVRDRLPGLEQLWMIDGLGALASGGAQVGEEQLDRRRTGRRAADLATIVYTSGTTGRPKGCELTHGNLLADVRNAVEGPLRGIFEYRGRVDTAVPAARALFRARHSDRLPGVRRDPGALARYHYPGCGPSRVPPHVLAVGAAGVRERLQQRPAAGLGDEGRD